MEEFEEGVDLWYDKRQEFEIARRRPRQRATEVPMNEREVSELRRRFRPDKSNITKICGCYVSDKGEILTQFTTSISLMLDDEKEKVLTVLKKALSGSIGKNLMDISFPTKQVLEGAEHKLLTTLRNSKLEDAAAAEQFYEKVISTVSMETNYLILLAFDAYDVPFKGKDGGRFDEGSDQVFNYIVCSICPVKLSKSGLSFHAQEQEFHNSKTEWIVAAPELGFLFPAFDDRSTNLYGALAYTRNIDDNHQEFINTIFGAEPPMAAGEQKETFQSILGSSLDTDCSMKVIQAVHAQLSDMIQEHKESKDKEPLVISKPEVNHVLKTCGLSEERVKAFDDSFDECFGQHADLSPKNLVDTNKFHVVTPDVKIQIAPDKRDLVETRVLGGVKYILIRAEEGVEVNGVPVEIQA